MDHGAIALFVVVKFGGAHGVFPHFGDVPLDCDKQHGILEKDPSGVLQPTPLTGGQHAINRLRPEHAAQQMIGSNYHSGGHQHAPVAIESEKS